MSKPIIKVHNTETNEIIEREMNDSEYQQHLEDVAKQEEIKAEAETKTAQRQAILDRLGLSQEEANILLGGN